MQMPRAQQTDNAKLDEALNADERAARSALDRGVEKGLAALDQIICRPLNLARRELELELLSLGPRDASLYKNLAALEVDRVAVRCARRVLSNASVHFRARFSFYSAALVAAEERFALAACVKWRPRRISVPTIEIENELTLTPAVALCSWNLDEWTAELGVRVGWAVRGSVERACDRLKKRGRMSLIRSRIAVRMASLAVSSSD